MENIAQKIFNYLKGNNDKTQDEISHDLGLPNPQTSLVLDSFLVSGAVTVVENPNSGEFYYHMRQE